jgi:hypothetical protein
MKLRIDGLTFEQIGQRMGFSGVRAYHIVKAELERMNQKRTETAAQMARLELTRLDHMFQAIWAKARKGDLAAQAQALKIMERRAKIMGLDASDRQQPAAAGTITLNISEVVVNRQELGDINDSNGEETAGHISDDAAGPPPRSPKRLPAF